MASVQAKHFAHAIKSVTKWRDGYRDGENFLSDVWALTRWREVDALFHDYLNAYCEYEFPVKVKT